MESQKYRARAGQLFVDNFGRLNMTVQTGSMVAVAGTWEAGPTGTFKYWYDWSISALLLVHQMRLFKAILAYQRFSGSAIYDGISWFKTSDVTAKNGDLSAKKSRCIGTVDSALFLRHSAGLKW